MPVGPKVRRIAHSLEALEEDETSASLAAMTSRQYLNRPSTAEADRDTLVSLVRRERAGRTHAERAVQNLQAKVSELEREMEEKSVAMEDLTEDLGIVRHALRDRTDAAKLAERDLRMQGIIFRTQSEQQQAACDELAHRLVITREEFSARRTQVPVDGSTHQDRSARSVAEPADALPAFRDTLWQLLATGGQTSWTPRAAVAQCPQLIQLTQQELPAAASRTQLAGVECVEGESVPTPMASVANIPTVCKVAESEVSTAAPTSLVALPTALPTSDGSEAAVKVVVRAVPGSEAQMSGRSLHSDRSATTIEDEALTSAAATVAKAATLAAADSATKAAMSGSDFYQVSAEASPSRSVLDATTVAGQIAIVQEVGVDGQAAPVTCTEFEGSSLLQAIAEEELEEPHAAMVPADEDGKVKDTADTQPPSQLSAAGMEQVQPACEAVMRQHQEGDKIVIPSGRLELDELSSRTDEANFAACSKEPQEGQSHGTLLGDEATCAVCATEPHEGQGHGLVLGDEANHAVCATEPHEAQGHETLQGDEENGAVRATELPEEQCHERMQPDRVDRAADGPVQQDRVHQDAEPSAFQIAAIVEEEEADDDDDAASADEANPSTGARRTLSRKAVFQKPPKVVPLESWFQLLPQKAGHLDSPKCSEWSEDSSDISDLFMVAKQDEPKVKKQKIGDLVRSSTDEILESKAVEEDEEEASEHAASEHGEGSSGSETESEDEDDEEEEEEDEAEDEDEEIEESPATLQEVPPENDGDSTSCAKTVEQTGFSGVQASKGSDAGAEQAGLQSKPLADAPILLEKTAQRTAVGTAGSQEAVQGQSWDRHTASRKSAEAAETRPMAPARPAAVVPPPASGRVADVVAAKIRGAVASSRSTGSSARSDPARRSSSVAELPRLKPTSQLPPLHHMDAGSERVAPNWDGRLVYPFEAFKYVRADRSPAVVPNKAPPYERSVPVKMRSKLNALNGVYNPLSANGPVDPRDRERPLPKVRSLPTIVASRSPYAASQRVR